MTLQFPRSSKLVRFTVMGLMAAQTAIATTAISAFVSIQPGWSDRAVAQEQLAPRSTSASDLGGPLQINCHPNNSDKAEAFSCDRANPNIPDDASGTPISTTTIPVEPIQVKLAPVCTHPSGSFALICISVP